jgi:ABC-type uncharacterized transport system fused permease/ATPase subunit
MSNANRQGFVIFLNQLMQQFTNSRQQPPPNSNPEGGDDHAGDGDTINNDRLILDELHKEYDRTLDLRTNIEEKAKTIITFSGVILTLLLEFITLYVDKVHIPDEILPLVKILIIFILGAIIASLVRSVISVLLGRNLNPALVVRNLFVRANNRISNPEVEF